MKRKAYTTWFAALAVVLLAAPVFAQTDMCIPTIGGLAGTPFIDGIVDGYTGPPGNVTSDSGWNNATRWNLSGDHGTTTATKLQAGLAGGFLYLSYVVDTPAWGQDNTIVIGFAGTGAAASTDWRIFISPFTVAPPPDGPTQPPFSVTYWRDSTKWNNNAAGTVNPAHWTQTNTRFSKAGTRWAVEIKIPVTNTLASAAADTAVYLPASGTFRFYTVVLSTYGFINPMTVVQDPWPASVDIPGGDLLQNLIPAPDGWGRASFNNRPECTGVSITWAGVGVRQPPGGPGAAIISEIRRFDGAILEANLAACNALPDGANSGSNGPNNEFVAQPFNSLIAAANGVFATFRLANWGIPAPQEFDKIGSPSFLGVSNNPTATATISPGLTSDLVANWALTYKQSCQYKFNPHQCIQVDIDSNDPSVRFLKKSVQRNMDFVALSKFERTAYVGSEWGKLLGRDADAYRLAILVETDRQFTRGSKPSADSCCNPRFKHEELAAMAPDVPRAAQLAWIARGILIRDDLIQIGPRKYRKGTRAGDFGYLATHTGSFYGWQTTFTGQGLVRSRREVGSYTLDVKRGRPMQLKTTLEALEKAPAPTGAPK
jgi:hypothetical protein